MKHSIAIPLVILKKERLSIKQIARQVINFYDMMTRVDDNYQQINIVSEKKSLYQSIDVKSPDAVQLLADEILNQNIDDIRRTNKIDDPDINFSRDEMISFGLEAKIDGETFITLNYSFSVKLPRIGSIVVNQKCFDSFSKAKLFLETIENSFLIEYSVIKISNRVLNKISREYNAPLGWITYFSNEYELEIPDDISGVEYEYTDKGKYLILTREPILENSGILELQCHRLELIMNEIKERVPRFSKQNL